MLSTHYTLENHMARTKIREIAESKNFNASSLSRRADLAYGTVHQLWNDPSRDVSLRTLEKLATALGVTVVDLIEDEPPPADDHESVTSWPPV
jgi:DNA-binding Xre family transcriptional regulator